jgi:hypothetical protein
MNPAWATLGVDKANLPPAVVTSKLPKVATRKLPKVELLLRLPVTELLLLLPVTELLPELLPVLHPVLLPLLLRRMNGSTLKRVNRGSQGIPGQICQMDSHSHKGRTVNRFHSNPHLYPEQRNPEKCGKYLPAISVA